MNQIEEAEQHRMLLLKALYKTRDPVRPRQDLNNVFEDFGLDEGDGMAAAQFLVEAGMLKWESDQQPGLVRLLHPGVVAAEKLLKEEKQAARLEFMRRAYGVVGGSTVESFSWEEVGKGIGLDNDAALEVSLYLRDKGLIRSETFVHDRLTQPGVDEVEKAIERPDEPTEHFPSATAMYNVFLGSVTGFQQQHSSPGASQHQHIEVLNADEVQLVETFVQEYRQQLDASNANDEALAQANEHLANIEAELDSEQPVRSVIKKAMQTLKPLGIGIGVNLTTQGIVAAFSHFT